MCTPEQLLAAIRDSFVGAEQVYTQGSCIMLYRILKRVWPTAEPYWSEKAKHMITRIDTRYFDIRGEVKHLDGYKLDIDEWNKVGVAIAMPQEEGGWYRFTQPTRL